MATNPGAFADALSPEEQAELDRFLNEEEPARAAPADAGAAEPAATEAPAPAAEPAATPPAAAPAADAPAAEPAAPAQTDEQRFAAFMERHKGKTPEELLQLAFQQEGRAQRAGFQQRQTAQSLEAAQTRMRTAAERAQQMRDAAAQRRTDFAAQIEADPDAATRELHERIVAGEEAEADRIELEAQIDGALTMATTAIPDFAARSGEVFAFGAEMNYTPEELNNIRDGRDLVTLTLASRFANLVKGGIVDISGNLLQAPAVTAQTDPRLTTPPPPATLSSAPARTTGGGKTPQQQADDWLGLSEADFAKLPKEEFDALMKQLEG